MAPSTAPSPGPSHHHHQDGNAGVYTLLIFNAFFLIWIIWIGNFCARLWYYKGSLQDEYEVFDIQPKYVRDRHRRTVAARNNDNNRMTTISTLDVSRWNPHLTVTQDEATDPVVQAYVREQRRISRLPAFVQDDCGDGSEFPNVPVTNKAEPIEGTVEALQESQNEPVGEPADERPQFLAPYAVQRRPNYKSYYTMGLRRFDADNWLTIDKDYKKFHEARQHLLSRYHDECIQVKAHGEEACEELMWEVITFLTKRYPEHFKFVVRGTSRNIRNEISKEEFSVKRPYDCHPLEMCARLCMEDFNILMKGELTTKYYLQASATLFPAGWHLKQRIGFSITDLHGPVPLWENLPDTLSYFNRLNANSPMERSSIFIQIKPDNRPLHTLLFIQEPKDFFAGGISNLSPDDVIVRKERQTFRRLPKSGAIVFSVRTYVQSLQELGEKERRELAKEIRNWPEEIAGYKGRDLWQTLVLGFCEGTEMVMDDRTRIGDSD